MMKRTTWKFDLKVTDEMDRAEYESLVRAIESLCPDGMVSGAMVKSDLFEITIETVECP